MVRVIEKKTWPDFFVKLLRGLKNIDVRINDFIVNVGDVIVFREYDPVKKEYTGRKVSRVVTEAHEVDINRFYKMRNIKKKGLLIMSLGQVK
jgi:predicted phosphohydrolase